MQIRHRGAKYALAAIALAALVVSLPVATKAKTQKPGVSATLGGKPVNWKGRLVRLNENPGSGLIVVATKRFGTKTIGVGCAISLAGQTFPLTTTACSMNYQLRKGTHVQGWLNPGLDPTNPVEVTIGSFDGTTVQGTFSGTLMSTNGDGSTLSVQGAFHGALGQ